MNGKTLKHPPLIEAIFEIKWQLQSKAPGLKQDPHYNLLIGRLYDELAGDYPIHQQLDSALIPAEMVPGIVQHRFRKGKDEWPLVQLGPGVFTVNVTKGYTWDDFKSRVVKGVNALVKVHPDAQNLAVDSLLVRYINTIPFDFDRENIFEFLEELMHTKIALHPPLFEAVPVERTPLGFDCRFAFRCAKPKATVTFRFSDGTSHGKGALIWQTVVDTRSDGIPKLPSELEAWLEDAHTVAETWFFQLIEGELQRRFE